MANTLKVLWQWRTMGPYHFARMKALSGIPGIKLTIIESSSSDDHGWARQTHDLDLVTLSAKAKSTAVFKATSAALRHALNQNKPDVVIACGYMEPYSLRSMIAYRAVNRSTLLLLWSESTALDLYRSSVAELYKRFLVSAFDGALVAGKRTAAYLKDLKMPERTVQIVGNCVDNDFFGARADAVRDSGVIDLGLPKDFFLFVGRLVPQKNLDGLISAYAEYRERNNKNAWGLVIVGTGTEKAKLEQRVSRQRIPGVFFAGMRQAEELPMYYGRARCFILPSVREPWGLVVNEAMASGLPVLVSKRCGCVADLVCEGENGFTFDPTDVTNLANLLSRVSSGSLPLDSFSIAARTQVANYTPAVFAAKTALHIRSLFESKRSNRALPTWLSRNSPTYRVSSASTVIWGIFRRRDGS